GRRAGRAAQDRPRRARFRRVRPPARRDPRTGVGGARYAGRLRAHAGRVIVYGRNAVRELLRAGRRPVHRVWASGGAAREPWLAQAAPAEASAAELERLCGSPGHQGVCAETSAYPYAAADELLGEPDPLIVALDE